MRKNDNINKLKASAIVLALAGLPLCAHAAGLGRLTVQSALGQPLRAEIELSANREEIASIAAKVAPIEQFRQQGIEYATPLSTLRFTVEKRSNGDHFLRLSSDRPLNEPFLDVLVELNWSTGRLVREYTFLLDPVGHARPTAPVHTPVVVPAVTAPPAPATVAEAKPAEEAKSAPVPAEQAPEPVAAKPSEPVKEAEQPARAEKGETPAAAKRKVKSGETLAKIASETKPEGVSLDQMLVALFVGNRDAFAGDNLNRLKAGKILTVPDQETAASITPAEAKKTLNTQSDNFNAYRRKLAAIAAEKTAAKEAQVSQQSSGKITPKVEDKSPTTAANKDKLEVSRAETSKLTPALDADRIAKEKAAKEAQARVADLEKQNAELRRMNEISSKAAADAQKMAQAKVEPKPEVKPVEPAKPADAVKPGEAAKPADVAALPETVKSADLSAVATAAKPAELPKKPKIILPPPEPEPSFMDEFGTLVYGGAGVVALLLALFGFKAYKRKRDAAALAAESPSQYGDGDFSVNSIFGQTGGRTVDTGAASLASDFSHSAPEGNSTAEGVDPVAEADVYMAYGRDAQAEEILLDAVKAEPSRTDVQLKLLEIYAGRKNAKAFESVAKQLHTSTGGSGEVWAKAVAMGQGIDPGNPLYGGSAQAAAGPVLEDKAFGATTVVLPSGALAQMAKLADSGEVPPELADDTEVPAPLDFDLDLGEQAANGAEGAAPPVLDFDLEAGSPAETASNAPSPVLDFDLELPETSAAQAGSSAANSIDFDIGASKEETAKLSESAAQTSKAFSAPAAAAKTGDDNAIDFNFSLDTPGETKAAPAELAPSSVDLSAISLDLEVPTESGHSPEAAPALAPVADLPADTAEDNPEVATKLELAQAYEEMGDKEGVRELLQEVLIEGTPAQQEIARQKLAKL